MKKDRKNTKETKRGEPRNEPTQMRIRAKRNHMVSIQNKLRGNKTY